MANLKTNQFILAGHLITEIPLLFQPAMVKANMEDRKTQTRRVIRDQMLQENKDQELEEFLLTTLLKCRFGKPGDLLWVRETMIRNNNSETYWPVADGYTKTADYEKTIPSIHLPKAFSRIWAMVEEIRVERLQDISEDDAKAEGCIQYEKETDWMTAKYGYQILWESINGEESWGSNPWVWVIKYRILSKTGRPSDEFILRNHLEITGKEVSNG